jgi:hypothetical protein
MKKLQKKKVVKKVIPKKKIVKRKSLSERELLARQERFCQLYATHEEFFGNGTQTYLEVYDIDRSKPNWYKTAQVCASKLLLNTMVLDRINKLLEEGGLNEAFVDKQLKLLITQNADFTNKLGAIKEFNKLKQRITDKTDLTSDGLPIQVISYKDVAKK